MHSLVTFNIANDIPFASGIRYETLGISAHSAEGKLSAFEVEVDHDGDASDTDIADID
jgi:hypothetical protein